MSILQKPPFIYLRKGKELADEFREISRRQCIDLSLADMEGTKKILSNLSKSLSEIMDSKENQLINTFYFDSSAYVKLYSQEVGIGLR